MDLENVFKKIRIYLNKVKFIYIPTILLGLILAVKPLLDLFKVKQFFIWINSRYCHNSYFYDPCYFESL
jgi:hypothetical protein